MGICEGRTVIITGAGGGYDELVLTFVLQF